MPFLHEFGNQLVLVGDDGTQSIALPMGGSLWTFGEPPEPPPPDPEVPPPPPPGGKRFIWPFDPRRYQQGGDVGPAAEADYGPRSGRVHQGQDFGYGKAQNGANVIAAANGRISYRDAGRSGFGYHAIIDHGDTLFTVYGHMQTGSGTVANGTEVRQGQVIGKVGNTGGSFGAHLHWETHRGGLRWTNPGTHMNPRDFMAQYG